MNELDFLYVNEFTKRPFTADPPKDSLAADWTELLARHAGESDSEILAAIYPQLHFPVRAGMSADEAYRAATLRGEPAKGTASGGESALLYLHDTPVGAIPVIEARDESDFILLFQKLACKNEPRPVPRSMGASMIKGLNNWARIGLLKERFLREHPDGDWALRFDEIRRTPELFRDHLLILSNRYYSGVEPEVMGLDAADWCAHSLVLRREHEVSHYLTQRYYGVSGNAVHDEIIADYMGLTAAFGRYDARYFLLFLGLEDYPNYREGGRLENYLRDRDLSRDAFLSLGRAVRDAAHNIAALHGETNDRFRVFHRLCGTSVAAMAANEFTG